MAQGEEGAGGGGPKGSHEAALLEIRNEKGLHARASAKFVATVERFQARVTVTRDGLSVSGDSIMGLLTLAAAKGSQIHVAASGPDAVDAMIALRALLEDRFGEGS